MPELQQVVWQNRKAGNAMSLTVTMQEAKTNLSRLLARVSAGEEIIITRAGTPVARLVAVNAIPRQRKLGSAAGRICIAPDFDAPLASDFMAEFEN
jgi:prevent-host-death family protein